MRDALPVTIARAITLPLTDEVLETLHAGDELLLTGVMYVGRDAAHKRMVDTLEAGGTLPVDLKGQMIYFMGPTPARPGKTIGSAGPEEGNLIFLCFHDPQLEP